MDLYFRFILRIMGEPMPITRASSWMTAKRLRAHGIILALALWSVYIWNMATPGLLDRSSNLKGTDFLHFYTLGSLALAHRGADLYNMQAQSELAAHRVPAAAGIRYLPLYPPQVSIFFAPFARLPYPWALLFWLSLSKLTYAVCCYAAWRVCPNLRNYWLTVFILAVAFPAFWHLVAWGQTSALALACFTLTFFAFRSKREFLAGLALGSLLFKPQLALAAALVFLITLRWRVIAGATLSAAAQLFAAFLYYGIRPIHEWFKRLMEAPHLLPLPRAQALSNALPAHILEHARSFAHNFFRALPRQRGRGLCVNHRLLAWPHRAFVAILCAAAGDRPYRATPHCLRPRHTCPCTPIACGFHPGSSAFSGSSSAQGLPLSRLRTATPRTTSTLDTRTAFGPRNDSHPLFDLENQAGVSDRLDLFLQSSRRSESATKYSAFTRRRETAALLGSARPMPTPYVPHPL